MTPADKTPPQFLLVTGVSGAGKSSTLRALEDLGFETVDNLPVALLPAIAGGKGGGKGAIAIGIDARTRDFDANRLLAALETVRREAKVATAIVFLDCDNDALGRRYAESRRPHPLADDLPLGVAIETERQLLAPLREHADLTIDTTRLLAADLRRILLGQYGGAARTLRVFLTSFGYRYGLPRDADLVFDVRFLKNPHYQAAFRDKTGLDPGVGAFIESDPTFAPFLERLQGFLEPLLPLYDAEGKSYLTIAVGCTGGQHRSVYVVERLKAWLTGRELALDTRHRDIHAGPAFHP